MTATAERMPALYLSHARRPWPTIPSGPANSPPGPRGCPPPRDPDGLRPLGGGPCSPWGQRRPCRSCTTSGASSSTTTACGTRPPARPVSPTASASCCAAPVRRSRTSRPGPGPRGVRPAGGDVPGRRHPRTPDLPADPRPAEADGRRAQLAPLRDEGVLIVGSGFFTHNLAALRHRGGGVPGWSAEFDDWGDRALRAQDIDALIDFEHTSPSREARPPAHRALRAAVRDAGRGRGRAGPGAERHRRLLDGTGEALGAVRLTPYVPGPAARACPGGSEHRRVQLDRAPGGGERERVAHVQCGVGELDGVVVAVRRRPGEQLPGVRRAGPRRGGRGRLPGA